VPKGAVTIFSAHGVSRAVFAEANAKGLAVIDATCPLVAKVHLEVLAARRQGLEVIVIGHRNHPEVEGTMGQADDGLYLVENVDDALDLAPKNPAHLTYVTQTTLSVDETRSIINALKSRFPHIQSPKKDDICYATQNRQDAVKVLAKIPILSLSLVLPIAPTRAAWSKWPNSKGLPLI